MARRSLSAMPRRSICGGASLLWRGYCSRPVGCLGTLGIQRRAFSSKRPSDSPDYRPPKLGSFRNLPPRNECFDYSRDQSDYHSFAGYDFPQLQDIIEKPPPRRFAEVDCETLLVLSSQRVHGAVKERMLREIMRVEQIEYGEAYKILHDMNHENEKLMWAYKLPYRVGIASGITVGLASVPCVFHRETAVWFCTNFVKEEVPTDPETLETAWKVGTWTWSWMEPAIGTASFVLLAMQLVRSHAKRIDLRPFDDWMQSHRANKLADRFAAYEREIVRDYAKVDMWGRDSYVTRRGHPANSALPLGRH